MAFTEFKFDPAIIKAETEQMKESLRKGNVQGDILSRVADVVEKNFHGDLQRYRDYGPYWWALKEILIKQGRARGNAINPEISKIYRGETDEETVIAAIKFQQLYLSQFFVHTNNFKLDPASEEDWYLYDPDYEDTVEEEMEEQDDNNLEVPPAMRAMMDSLGIGDHVDLNNLSETDKQELRRILRGE